MAKSIEEIKAELAAKRQSKAVVPVSQNGHGAAREDRVQRDRTLAVSPQPRRELATLEEKPLPNAIDAERGVLGAMIQHPIEVIPYLRRKQFDAEMLYTPAHYTIASFAFQLFDDEGTFDYTTFLERLKDVGRLDAVGGPAFVTHLSVETFPVSMVPYYLDILRDKYVSRQIIALQTEFAMRAYTEQDVAGLLAELVLRCDELKGVAHAKTRLPELRDLSMMVGDNVPKRPPELVTGMLHQGSKLIVGGTSKGRKTYSLIDLAVAVATGHSWWGFDCAQGEVCYINFEIQEAFFCERVTTICDKKGVTLGPGMLVGWNLRGHGEGIENLMNELLAVLRSRKFVLIIFDPIYKALGDRDENKAGDVASMLNELEKIAVQTGAAIAFGAHYSKGNQAAKESIDRIGGSGVFARDPDSILTMTPHEEEDAFTVEATLRNFKPMAPFVVKWDWPLFQRDPNLDPESLRQAKGAKGNNGQFAQKFSTTQLLEQLSVIDGVLPKDACKTLYDSHNMSRAAVYRLKNELQAKGLLIIRDGMWFKGQGNGS